MDQDLVREIRRLKRINAVSIGALAMFAAVAFTRSAAPTKFDVIDVGRINIREPDGTIRLAISNKAHFPDPIIDGKTYPLRGGAKPAGMIFFNDLGDEDGGLIWSGKKTADGFDAGASLTMDQWRQDQTVQLSYEGGPKSTQWVGLRVIDRPQKPMTGLLDEAMKAMKLPEGPHRDSAMQSLQKLAVDSGLTPASRILIGKGAERAASVRLNDPAGHTRILLRVDSLGTPTMQFLDADGKVTYEIPANAH
ncbi:MAG TPA: hypothetical protein VGO46_19305 [Gemmatimonadaceae bacterium]|jgi:hypothetical protein|nr:hypothetical protein [Gemmatimonadaceae bacterium]